MYKYINDFRYWNFARIFFVTSYILIGIFSAISLYKALHYPKKDTVAVVVYKDKYITNTGDLKFYVELKDSGDLFKNEIKYGVEYDTIQVGEKINLKMNQKTAYIFATFFFLGLMFVLFKFYRFWEIVTRTERNENE